MNIKHGSTIMLGLLLTFGVMAGFILAPLDQQRRRNAEARLISQLLHQPDRLTLYSLNPEMAWTPKTADVLFHRYPVLGEVVIAAPEERQRICQLVETAMAAWDGSIAGCFNPRHGLRITNGDGTLDYVICFECRSIEFYSSDKALAGKGLVGSQSLLDEILQAAKIPLAKDIKP